MRHRRGSGPRGISLVGRSVFEQRRAWIGWLIAIAGYSAFLLAVYPSMRDSVDLDQLVQQYPEAMRKMFAISDIRSPAGFLDTYLFSMAVPLFLIIYAVLAAGSTTAGEEEIDTIDLLLANPISRKRVLLEKFGAIVMGTVVLAAGFDAIVFTLGRAVGLDADAGRVLAATAADVLLAVSFAALALLLGAATGRKAVARGVTGALAALAYLSNSLGSLVAWLDPWRVVSPFYHAIGEQPIRNGLGPDHALVLIGIAAAFVAVAAWRFERRDLAV